MGFNPFIKIKPWSVIGILAAGCATPHPHSEPRGLAAIPAVAQQHPVLAPIAVEDLLTSKPDAGTEIKKEISASNPPPPPGAPLGDIPLELNEHVQKWILYFTKKDRERFQRFLNQGEQYREVVENVLEQNQLPPELYYLAMIESGYSTRATSLAKAAGVWQFIPATGKRYGLEVNPYNDERRDPIRATEAAAKYLRDLYNVFGSWYLAVAAYNAGEFRIMTSVIRGKSRDFWTLVKKGVLPAETADYIPKFLAAIQIGENGADYGFAEPTSEKYPNLRAIEVPSPTRLLDLAKLIKLAPDELKRLNPNLRSEITPPNNKHYDVWVPEEYVQNFDPQKVQLAQFRVSHRTYKKPSIIRYRVKKGDHLNQIAQRFNTSVRALQTSNSLRKRQIYVGQILKIRARGT